MMDKCENVSTLNETVAALAMARELLHLVRQLDTGDAPYWWSGSARDVQDRISVFLDA